MANTTSRAGSDSSDGASVGAEGGPPTPPASATPDATAVALGNDEDVADGGAESVSVDTFGLPNAAAPSISGGIADDAATMVSLMTDDFGSAGVASQVDPPRGGSNEEGDGVLPSPPVSRDGDGRTEVMKGDVYFDSSEGGGQGGRDDEVTAYTGDPALGGMDDAKEGHHDVHEDKSKGEDNLSASNKQPAKGTADGTSGAGGAGEGGTEGGAVSNSEEATMVATPAVVNEDNPPTQRGVTFVPGPDYRGGIQTGYHSAHDSEDDDNNDADVENQNLIEAYAVDDNEQAEIIDELQEQLGSARQELEAARSQLAAPAIEGIPIDDKIGPSNNKSNRNLFIIGFILFLGTIGVAVGLAISFSKKSDIDETPEDTAVIEAVAPVLPPVLEALQERKVLRCGIHKYDSRGFISFNNETNTREGFEVDLCKAVAAASLGSNFSYELVPTTGLTRFADLASGEFDVLVASTTHTFDRDVHESSTGMGFSFSTPYLYGGMTYNGVPEFVKCADELSAVGDCAGILICSILGTTWYDTTKELFPASNIVLTKEQGESFQNLIDGKCNVIQGEQYEAPEVVVRGFGYEGPYGQGKTSFTKDPLAMVTRDGDPEFAALVEWVLQTLIFAEKENITMMTADTFAESVEFFGKDMFQNALAAVGNYGEIYTRHLVSISPRLEINDINDGETTGLMYSHPLGKVDTVGPGPINGGVIERILQRDFLRCGIPGATQDATSDKIKRVELDMEFCRALSASVFQRTPDNVSFQSYSDDDDIYLALENGDIDVYAGGEVDVGSDFLLSGLSFSNPYFHEGGKAFALVTREDDEQWADFVYWVTMAMATIYAEENGITQNTSNEMPLVNLFGTDLQRLLRDAILAVGNYDEMYRQVFGQNATRVGLNKLNASPFGPQHYPLPF
mmetsp:Transcript_33757/g.68692  ORF Transcript_33757/g.68692 Transcript_33757/m.68692 type:complete len:906 (+) Transcript_33757:85-2802(+)